MNYFGIYANSGELETALVEETLNKPYVAIVSGVLDYDSVIPVPPAETRLKITYNFETTDETPVLSNFTDLFNHAPGKAEFPDGTEFIYDPNEQYEDTTINYTPAETGIASVYFTFSGDTIGNGESGSGLLEMTPAIAIEIPYKVNTIGMVAFYGAAYSAVTFPNHSLTIGNSSFCGLGEGDALVSVSIPSGSVLCGDTFFMQVALEDVTIGQGVTFGLDGNGDFAECYSLTSITFLDTTPPAVNDTTFSWMRLDDERGEEVSVDIHVPVGSENAYADSFNQDCTSVAFRYLSPGMIEAYSVEE